MRYLLMCLAVLSGPFLARGADATSLTLSSSVLAQGEELPGVYTCDGADRSPPLAWSGVPAGTETLALVVDDPDAPRPSGWVHWVLYDLPPDTTGLAEGVTTLPPGAREGLNDWRRTGYGGPCPPSGRHRYVFKLYALDQVLGDQGRVTRDRLERAMAGHILEQVELMGTYHRRR